VSALSVSEVVPSSFQINTDAVLIRTCHEFARKQFDQWWRYVQTPIDEDAIDEDPDWNIYHWIANTPASTPEGVRAKALAVVAWYHEAYDDCLPDKRDSFSTFLASLMRDLVNPERSAIIAEMKQKYGPLPEHYSDDAVFMGYAKP
jgi:hypothetical protein